MLFRMQSNMLFRLFPLLTAQAGFAPVDICLISENCYNYSTNTLFSTVCSKISIYNFLKFPFFTQI